MKIIFYIFLIISTSLVSYASDTNNKNRFVRFLDIEFNESIKIAKKENKLIMMFIHEHGGPWCGKMRRNAFVNKDVVSILDKSYISIQFDKYEDEIDIPEDLMPSFIPMVYLIDPKTSDVIVQLKGYASASSLYDLLEETMDMYSE